MVLLDALAPLARARGISFSAIHVNHGISPHAETWATFCAEQCASRSVTLSTLRLALGPGRSANLEAVARQARYRALRAADVDVIALAHHVDDQAETVLLQLLRGAGPRGLSAMQRYQPGTPALWRPLLDLTRVALAAYASERGLAWIEDESNANTHYKRNLLRHDISPRLAAHFPGYPATLARAAEHQAEASGLLDALAIRRRGRSGPSGRARLRAAHSFAACSRPQPSALVSAPARPALALEGAPRRHVATTCRGSPGCPYAT